MKLINQIFAKRRRDFLKELILLQLIKLTVALVEPLKEGDHSINPLFKFM